MDFWHLPVIKQFLVRSESICSGRSTPNSGRLVSNDISGDLVPVDFSGISFGKSTSGSVHSTDSPSRWVLWPLSTETVIWRRKKLSGYLFGACLFFVGISIFIFLILSFSRSRTSSFGCGQRCYGIRDPGDIVIHALDSELESTSASAPRRNHDASKEHCKQNIV